MDLNEKKEREDINMEMEDMPGSAMGTNNSQMVWIFSGQMFFGCPGVLRLPLHQPDKTSTHEDPIAIFHPAGSWILIDYEQIKDEINSGIRAFLSKITDNRVNYIGTAAVTEDPSSGKRWLSVGVLWRNEVVYPTGDIPKDWILLDTDKGEWPTQGTIYGLDAMV
jgi:hypothetical protein